MGVLAAPALPFAAVACTLLVGAALVARTAPDDAGPALEAEAERTDGPGREEDVERTDGRGHAGGIAGTAGGPATGPAGEPEAGTRAERETRAETGPETETGAETGPETETGAERKTGAETGAARKKETGTSSTRVRWLGYGLCALGTAAVPWFTVEGYFPPSAPVAAAVFGAATLADWAGVRRSGLTLERAAVASLVLLGGSVWLSPLAGVALPDVGVLGGYTYLATEVAFGALAFGLLVRAGRGAIRRAARTIVVLYPVAYLWDWYTLEVGVFAIQLRTGVELAGIPLEEHLFMVVVPALVLGVHETLDRVGSG